MATTNTDTDIFVHSAQNKSMNNNDFVVSSTLFTTSTPNKQIINDLTETSYINTKLMNIHNKIMDSEFLPISNTDVESASASVQSGGAATSTHTRALPINYSESYDSSSVDFEYGIGEIEETQTTDESTDESSESSSPTNSSDDSDEPVRRKKYILKRTNSKSSSSGSRAKPTRKSSVKKPVRKTSVKKPAKKTSRKQSKKNTKPAKKTSRKKSKGKK